MFNTLRISLSLKNTYRVNSILYSLKQIPLLRRVLPTYLYRVRGLKQFANVLSVIWEIISIFIWKAVYFLTMVVGACSLYDYPAEDRLFLHILFFLTLIGSYMNMDMFNPSKHRYYAIVLLRMDARLYTLSHFGYSLLKTVIGFLPFTILFGMTQHIPLWICIMIPFGIASAKLTSAAWSLWDYEKAGKFRTDRPRQLLAWGLTGALLAITYLLPVFGLVLPLFAAVLLWAALIPLGIVSLYRINRFHYYSEVNKELLSQVPFQAEIVKSAVKSANEKAISNDTSITSRKKGFEYLNELFIKRHRKILWKSALRIACVCAILCMGALIVMAFRPETKSSLNHMVMTWLPYFSFIMYMINRGTGFTNALFMNCDHSLLTYSFYKQPKFILKLFQIRLREITKVNALPAVVIGAGLCLILWASGGTDNALNYVVLFITILALSTFFSIHYLTVYYLLQPYTAGTEMKSGTYRVVMILTYVVCYAIMNLRLPILIFGVACIIFCVAYSIIASILVYRFAPQTFKLRS